MAASKQRVRLILQSTASCGLGKVALSGFMDHSRGIPLNRMRVYGSYALVYLLEGSGRMRSGRQPAVRCRKGDLLFLYPEIPHAYGPGPGEYWNELFVTFNGPVFDFWLQQGLLDPGRPLLHLPRISHWLPRLEAVADPRLPDTSAGMLERVCRLQKFMAEAAPVIAPPETGTPWLNRAIGLLMEEREIPAREVARALGLSYESFRKEFARQTGHAPGQYRQWRRIDRARTLMTARHLSNKEIAETLGFYDEFHFSRQFRNWTGQTPRAFREQLMES
jgi:AraC-like DNA-binding protein